MAEVYPVVLDQPLQSGQESLLALLAELNVSLLISTLVDHQVWCIGGPVKAIGRHDFNYASGLASDGMRLAITGFNTTEIYVKAAPFDGWSRKETLSFDRRYRLHSSLHTSLFDMHDIQFGGEALWGVNTAYSCLVNLLEGPPIKPHWQPFFISELAAQDRCHLNGLALENEQPRYVTALGAGDSQGSWRPTKFSGGVLMDVPTNQIILENLAMPHSPRIIDGKLYLLLSATQQLVCVDVTSGCYDVVLQLPGLPRGMVAVGDYLLIGTSVPRGTNLPLALQSDNSSSASIVTVHLSSGQVVGEPFYLDGVREVFDLVALLLD